jgi:hypothetical protein
MEQNKQQFRTEPTFYRADYRSLEQLDSDPGKPEEKRQVPLLAVNRGASQLSYGAERNAKAYC